MKLVQRSLTNVTSTVGVYEEVLLERESNLKIGQ